MAQSPSLLCLEDPLCNDHFAPQNHPLFWENEELITLFSKEQSNRLNNELLKDPIIAKYRKEAIDWILNVNTHYCFSHLTAVLAVDYIDRFLCRERLRREKPWMTQLAAVACLSLAAKMEETHVPLLLDLQVEECRYVFEAKTIKRMEILVLSTLEWKMNPVTPISFIDYFLRRLGLENHFCCEFLSRCQGLIVSLISDSRFLKFLPSVLATATMQHIINATYPCFKTKYQKLIDTVTINKDEMDDCLKLISDSTFLFFGYNSKRRKLRSTVPESPNGVIDVCFSSDNSNDSSADVAYVSPSPELLSKKIKAMCHEAGVSG